MKFKTKNVNVEYFEQDGTFNVTVGNAFFTNHSNPANFTKSNGEITYFNDAVELDVKEYNSGYGNGVYIKYSFDDGIKIITSCVLEDCSEILHFDITVIEGEEKVREISWPTSMDMKESSIGYTIIPLRQGILIPDDSEHEMEPVYEKFFYSRDAVMPWWGQVSDGTGYMTIVKTPFDAAISYKHEPFKPTVIKALWKPSLNKLLGTRQLQMQFYDKNCDYMLFCNKYKAYAKETGIFITLKEKAIKNPLVEKLIGSTVFNTKYGYWHCEPESYYYNKKDSSKNDVVITFDEHAKILERIKKCGIDKMYVHFDGWNRMGYDNQHPDVWPPHERCGGVEGFRHLYEKCKELGYLFAIHDQYRDFYTRSPSFDVDQATYDADGNMLKNSEWPGGTQGMLCQKLAGYYVRRNYELMKKEGLLPQGAYLDVFSATHPDECSHERHRVTRSEGMELRGKCFEQIRNYGMLVSSEEPIDCYIPHLDLVHHMPYYYDECEWQSIPECGIPVPLGSIVYSTCIFIPWEINVKNPRFPTGESAFLHCLLAGGIPSAARDISEEHVEMIRLAGKVNSAVWDQEIVNFEYLSNDYKIRKTTFANNVSITADFNKNEADIDWGDGNIEHIVAPTFI